MKNNYCKIQNYSNRNYSIENYSNNPEQDKIIKEFMKSFLGKFCSSINSSLESLLPNSNVPNDCQNISVKNMCFIKSYNPQTGSINIFVNGLFEDKTKIKSNGKHSLAGEYTGGLAGQLPGSIPKVKPCPSSWAGDNGVTYTDIRDDGTTCYTKLYSRGAGRIPDKKQCSDWNSNYRDDGTSCWADSYGRGGGRVPDVSCPSGCSNKQGVGAAAWCDNGPRWDFWNLRTCSANISCGSNEERNGGLCYPKCRDGYNPAGCCLCEPNGGAGIKVTAFDRYKCNNDEELSGALCYPKCQNGYSPSTVNFCQPDKGFGGFSHLWDRQYCPDNTWNILGLCYSAPPGKNSPTGWYVKDALFYSNNLEVQALGYSNIMYFGSDGNEPYVQIPPINVTIDKVSDSIFSGCGNFPFSFGVVNGNKEFEYILKFKTGKINMDLRKVFLKLKPYWFNIRLDINLNGELDIDIPLLINPKNVPANAISIIDSPMIKLYLNIDKNDKDSNVDFKTLVPFVQRALAAIAGISFVIPVIGPVAAGILAAMTAAISALPSDLFKYKIGTFDPLAYFVSEIALQKLNISFRNFEEDDMAVSWNGNGIGAKILNDAIGETSIVKNLLKGILPKILQEIGVSSKDILPLFRNNKCVGPESISCLGDDRGPWNNLYNYIQNTYYKLYLKDTTNKLIMIQTFFQGPETSLPEGGLKKLLEQPTGSINEILCSWGPYIIEKQTELNKKLLAWFQSNRQYILPNVCLFDNMNEYTKKIGQLFHSPEYFQKRYSVNNLQDLPLNKYPFIASHDSATGFSDKTNMTAYISSNIPIVRTQEQDFFEQYDIGGARFFDCRVKYFNNNTSDLIFHHEVPIVSVNQNKSFVNMIRKSIDDKELTILCFGHYAENHKNFVREYIKKFMTDNNFIKNCFIIEGINDLKQTMNYYLGKKNYIIILYDEGDSPYINTTYSDSEINGVKITGAGGAMCYPNSRIISILETPTDFQFTIKPTQPTFKPTQPTFKPTQPTFKPTQPTFNNLSICDSTCPPYNTKCITYTCPPITQIPKIPQTIGSNIQKYWYKDSAATTYIYGKSLKNVVGYKVNTWKIYAQGIGNITPVIFEKVIGKDEFIVRGYGKTQNIDAKMIHQTWGGRKYTTNSDPGIKEFNFELQVGSNIIINENYYFGWQDGTANGAMNTGIISWQSGGENIPIYCYPDWDNFNLSTKLGKPYKIPYVDARTYAVEFGFTSQ